jgi:GntR family transcriptional regulator
MKSKGIEIKNYELHVSWQLPIPEVVQFFAMKESAKIVELRHLRGNKERLFVYFVSYFNPLIGLTGEENFTMPLYEILEKRYNTIAKLSKGWQLAGGSWQEAEADIEPPSGIRLFFYLFVSCTSPD